MLDINKNKDWFIQELSERLEDEGLLIRDVANHCQISQDRMNNYMQGRALPNPYVLAIMADFLSCTVNDLLGYYEADEDELVGFDPLRTFEDEDEFMIHIRNRLEERMLAEDMTAKELGEKSGSNTHTIKYWLGKLKRQPPLIRTSDLLRLADALNCTPSDLLGY